MALRIISIVGTRPQILKLAPLSKHLDYENIFDHTVIHTGQHYDDNLSKNHFNSLEIRQPDYNLKFIRYYDNKIRRNNN